MCEAIIVPSLSLSSSLPHFSLSSPLPHATYRLVQRAEVADVVCALVRAGIGGLGRLLGGVAGAGDERRQEASSLGAAARGEERGPRRGGARGQRGAAGAHRHLRSAQHGVLERKRRRNAEQRVDELVFSSIFAWSRRESVQRARKKNNSTGVSSSLSLSLPCPTLKTLLFSPSATSTRGRSSNFSQGMTSFAFLFLSVCLSLASSMLVDRERGKKEAPRA